MDLNLALAIILVAITTYTDSKKMIIYNKHVLPFIVIGILLTLIQGTHGLLIDGLLVFVIYFILFSARKALSKAAVMLGGLPMDDNAKPLAGGDVKLATALALLIGAVPVLYGTMLAAVLVVMVSGIKAWKVNGNAMSVFYIAAGKMPAPPAAFGAFLGPCSIAVKILLNS